MVILLILFFLVMTIIPWDAIEEQRKEEAEKNVKYVHVTEEDMPGFLKVVEKLGG